MNARHKLLAALIFCNSIVSMVCGAPKTDNQMSVATVAATALTILGLGGIGWYLLQTKSPKKPTKEQEAQQRIDAILHALTSRAVTTEADFASLTKLLEQPSSVHLNKQGHSGSLPLINAAQAGNQAMVKFLLFHGAQINGKDSKGNTALMYAVNCGNVDMVKLLLHHEASIAIKNNAGKTAFNIAYDAKRQDILRLLQQQQKRFVQAFFEAARTGDSTRLEQLLVDVPLDERDSRGETALFVALRHNHIPLAELLLYYGARPDLVNKKHESILFPLIAANPQETQPAVLAHVLNNYPSVSQLINQQNSEGNTPLMYAAALRKPAVVAVLLEHGARTSFVNKTGYSVFDIAESPGTSAEEKQILALLRS